MSISMKDRVLPRATAAVCAFALLVAMASVLVGASVANAQSCTLVPTIAGVTVNQGIDDYSPLAWGKETIVRPYLVLPSCAKPGSIDTTGASLAVKLGVGPAASTVASLSPFKPITTSKDITACCTPSSDSAADPLFLVPADVMAQGLGDVPLTFAIAVNYKTSTGQTGVVTSDVVRTLGKRPNPFRVLYVPMSDNRLATPFAAGDKELLQSAILSVSRMFPVPASTDTLAAASTSTAGLRWQLAPSVLDLGPGTSANPGLNVLGSDNKFCGGNANWSAVQLGLAKYIQGWNAANPTQPIDSVAGAVAEGASVGGSGGCNDGQADAPGSISWTRMASGSPSITGAVLAQEFEHNFGVVPPADGRHFGWHSIEVQAEAKDRAYNLTTRSWLGQDRSVMGDGSSWNQATTLLEQADWAWTACMLTGSATGCAAPGKTGSPAAGATLFEISGTTDGSKQGTQFVSNKTDDGAITPEAEESSDPDRPNYFMVYRGGNKNAPGAIIRSVRMPVSFGETDHVTESPQDATGSVDARFVFDDAATLVEVWKGAPDAGLKCSDAPRCLYSAEATSKPQILSLEVTPTRWAFRDAPCAGPAEAPRPCNATSTSGRDEIQPALSYDGNYLAFVERDSQGCGALVVVRLVGGTYDKARSPGQGEGEACGGALPQEPALSPDMRSIAFVRDGDLWRVAFDPENMAFGDETRIYSCVREAGACVTGGVRPPLTGPASSPSWSPDPASGSDQWLAFSVQNDIYRLYPFRGIDLGRGIGVAQPEQLTSDGRSSEPSVGPLEDGSQYIAFRRQTDAGPALVKMDVTADGRPTEKLVCCGRSPSWGGELIAYEDTTAAGDGKGLLSFVNPDSKLVESVTTPADNANDTAPALVASFGQSMAVERKLGSQRDIFLGGTESRRDITMLVRDDNPGDIDGYIYVRCGGVDAPVAVALQGKATNDPSVMAFVADEHDTSIDCHNAITVGLVSDDFNLSDEFEGDPIVTPIKDPIASIHNPTSGMVVHGDRPLPLSGSAWDPEGMVLTGDALRWNLKLPGATSWTEVPMRGGHVDVAPAALGLTRFPTGLYRARLVAEDAQRRTAESVVEFTVLGGEAIVDFEPNTLQLSSSGTPVTTYVSSVADLAKVRSARITAIDGVRLQTPIDANSWKYDTATGVGHAQFDRQKLSAAIPASKDGQRILITIEGCKGLTWNCGDVGDVFAGADPNAPLIDA